MSCEPVQVLTWSCSAARSVVVRCGKCDAVGAMRSVRCGQCWCDAVGPVEEAPIAARPELVQHTIRRFDRLQWGPEVTLLRLKPPSQWGLDFNNIRRKPPSLWGPEFITIEKEAPVAVGP